MEEEKTGVIPKQCENNMDSLVFPVEYLYIGIRKKADERGNTMETIQFLCFSMTTEQLTMILKMIQILGIFIPVISIVVILQKEQSKSATYLMLAMRHVRLSTVRIL